MRGWVRALATVGCVTLTLTAVAADSTTPDDAPADPYADLRGLILERADLLPRDVMLDAPVSLPATAPAYRVEPPRTADLRALAERYAGGPVRQEPASWSTDLTGFWTGDGWFAHPSELLDADRYEPTSSWSWTSAADVQPPSRESREGPCPAGYVAATDRVPAFFASLGFDATVMPPVDYCYGERTAVGVALTLDGLPLIGIYAGAMVDAQGDIMSAYGPLWRLEPLDAVALAPAHEVVRRLQWAPGLISGPCYECTLTTRGSTLGLAYATTGGLGEHDHIPGGIVDRPPSQVLVPSLRVPGTSGNPRETHAGVVAVSTAVLVDDPADAAAAAVADTAAPPADAARACTTTQGVLTVCASQLRITAGTPVVVTVSGERYAPVGAAQCDPMFTVDPGDGSPAQSFLPRSGTLITGRVAVAFDEPGTYLVTARAASLCQVPAPPGGTASEYDYTARVTIAVT